MQTEKDKKKNTLHLKTISSYYLYFNIYALNPFKTYNF